VSGRVKLKDKTGSSSAQTLGLNSDIKESGRISQIIVTVLNLKCTEKVYSRAIVRTCSQVLIYNIIKYGSINHVKSYYKPVFQNIPV
ncbi:hypothetical protein IGI04_030717, partial [Brassica rapa subsp. trilocularis]